MDKSGKKRILLKIGSNTLTRETDQISRGKIEDIARQINILHDDFEFIIVSSGAIAVARQFVNLERIGEGIKAKQALAAIGQPHLMRIYQENFRELGLYTSQCLLSYNDFERELSKENIYNTINILISNSYIPIINENDTVATDEIKFGDNDKLAALTASLLKVDLVVFATNTNGIYTKASIEEGAGKTIAEVRDTGLLLDEVSDHKSSHGSGGMASKIMAASILQQNQIETWLVNGLEDNFIINALEGRSEFTKILV